MKNNSSGSWYQRMKSPKLDIYWAITEEIIITNGRINNNNKNQVANKTIFIGPK
jgi:hypothetical protein